MFTKRCNKNYNVIISGKNFYDQLTDSDIKRCEEIRKLTTGQGEDHTTGCLLDYDYIKNHYRLITVDLSRQKELDADSKAIQQIEFVGQLKKLNNANDNSESMFALTILEKIKKNEIKIFSRKCNSIINNTNYQEARVKLTHTQLNRLKSAAKSKAGTILRLDKKNLKMKNCQMNFFKQQDKQLR